MAETGRAQEVVRRLLDAEKGATARLADAEERARQRLASAQEDANRTRADARERAAREGHAALATARSEAEAEAAALIATERERWQHIADAARGRIGAAANDVVAWICDTDDAEEPP